MNKGFMVNNVGDVVSLNYKHVKFTFCRIIHATDGCLTGILMKPISLININRFANTSISNERIMISIVCTSYSDIAVRKHLTTIEMYGFKSSRNFETCEQCAIAKAQQKNVNKNWLSSRNVPGVLISAQLKKKFRMSKVLGYDC
jgi:hypothetical protein